MLLSKNFEKFCNDIKLDTLDDMKRTAGEIAKKLNNHYYDLSCDTYSHMYIVGSVGRKTAIAGNSDLDLLFDLPNEVYKQYNDYGSNGQSALLQDVKKVLFKRYPNTSISGDGQVVVIAFNKYTVELVPGFKQSDSTFKYPDTHNGGSWKYTNPLIEQLECCNCNINSNEIYYDFCHIIRAWKNTIGFKMGGLLIDTLIYNFFQNNDNFSGSDSNDYLQILTDLFKYLKDQNPNQNYWYAVGSKQQVNNSDNGVFVTKAQKAYTKLSKAIKATPCINNALRELLGNNFPKRETDDDSNLNDSILENYKSNNTEEIIEELFPVDIRYDLQIDCMVTRAGWRSFYLREFLRAKKGCLHHHNKLEFFILSTDCPKPYEIYWKVRNIGSEAIRRNMIRGQINKTNLSKQFEHTDFAGQHYVECYLIKHGVCVARAHIDVPIGWD